MSERVLNRSSKKALMEFLVGTLKLEEEQAEIFVESRDIELKKREILEKLDNELATKDFVRAEVNRLDKKLGDQIAQMDNKIVLLDKKFTVWFMVILAVILITNPGALELVQKLLGLVK